MNDNDRTSLVLRSVTEEIPKIKPFLKGIQNRTGFDEEMFNEIRLALNEAVMNAINHGNKNDPTKKVFISVEQNATTLTIHVKDEGSGFDANDIPDPTDTDNLLKPSGRGIFLIKQHADDVSYSKKEATITMKFNLE